MNKFFVLQVTPFFFPQIGGVENHVFQVSRRLAEAGVHTTVLTTDTGGNLPTYEESAGVRIRRVKAWPARRDYYFAPQIFPIIHQCKWDLVHIQSYHTLVPPMAMLAALRARIPYVVTFHGGGHSSLLRKAFRHWQFALLRPLLKRSERLVATARFEIEFFGKRLGIPEEKFVFIPNGGDLAAAEGKQARTNPSLIVSVGRLERYKGHHRVIAALPKILEKRPDVRLWIAGSGPYENALRNLARKLGVEERVEIRGVPAVERNAFAAELSQAALVILLSEYETNPMSILEALTLGRSVLVANTSGLKELAEEGFARAIPIDSTPDQVADAVLRGLMDPLNPPPVDLPSWDDCAARLFALYESVLQEKSSCVS